MKKTCFALLICFSSAAFAFGQEEGLLIDDFEGAISGGPIGSVDFGAGNGSSVEVTAATDIKHSGKQSLKVVYNAVPGGYMWVARGYGLEAKNANWQILPEGIKWNEYKAVSFYVYGSDSKTRVSFDIKDNGNEMWRFLLEDNFKGWKQIICPFNEFFPRSDWQPGTADKNSTLDFPVKSFQFEPLPESKGTLYFDEVGLIKE